MIKKIRQWLTARRTYRDIGKQLDTAYNVGYNDGKRDGLTIARDQATKSLKEILWQQNKQEKQKLPTPPQ